MSLFQPGDTVFTVDGQQAEYIAASPNGGHVVGAIYDAPGAVTGFRNVIEVALVFAEAPRPRLDAQIAERQAKLAEVTAQLSEANRAKFEAERLAKENAKLVDKLAMRHRVLQRIDDWLDGKFTHVVIQSGYDRGRMFSIKIKEEAIKPRESYDRKTRLVTLEGSSNGNLEWDLGYYSDHSGGKQIIHLAQSRDEAEQILRDLCAEMCEQIRAAGGISGLEELGKSLAEIGESLPADLAERFQAHVAQRAADEIAKAESALQAAKQRAAALRGKGVA